MVDAAKLTTIAFPPPGSDEALVKGCTCPVIDNGHGRGYYGQPGVYVYTVGCPVHAPAITTNFTDTSARPATRTAYGTGADD